MPSPKGKGQIRTEKHWDGIVPTRTRGTDFGKLGDRWKVRQLQPAGTLVLKKPVEKHGSKVTYRSVVTSASAAIPFRSLLFS